MSVTSQRILPGGPAPAARGSRVRRHADVPVVVSGPEDNRPGWRSDIDGLRAVAVGPVVVFHLAQSFLPGGFVGVDIFFVISGYLISRNIFARSAAGRFSILTFYEHRLRRIFPAYAAVLFAVLLVDLVHALPPDAETAGRTLLAAIASVTNIWFWTTTDYFAQPAESLPLLHTWSLSVEEQFYLVFPALVLWAGGRSSRRLRPALVVLFLVSLAISVPGSFLYPTASFYLLPARAWELLLGSLLALGLVPALRSRLGRELATAGGLLLIATSMLLLTPRTPFPGLAALPPCLGAALILHAGESGDSLGARLLSLRPLVFLGLISYSLYLWHWPLLAFQRTDMLLFATESKLVERGALLGLSLAAATLSWWLIEKPTRDRTRVSIRTLVAGSAAAASVLLAAATALVVTGGLPSRFTPAAVTLARYLENDQTAQFREGHCFLGVNDPVTAFDRSLCLSDVPGRPNYILLGDSHAAHLYAGLHAVLPEANILQVTGVQCAPLVIAQPQASRACPGLIELAATTLPAERPIAKVWLSAAWNSSRLGPSPGWSADWLVDLKRTVAHFRGLGIEAVIIGPSPEYRLPLPALMARAAEDGRPGRVGEALIPDPLVLDRMMAAFSAENGLTYVSLIDRLCADGTCRDQASPGIPLDFDRSHFTVAGSDYVARRIVDALR